MKKEQIKVEKDKKLFSIKYKLMIIFGLMATISTVILIFISVKIAEDIAIKKVEKQLVIAAQNTAKTLDTRINAAYRFLRGMAFMPLLKESTLTFEEKAEYLHKAAKKNPIIKRISVVNSKGVIYCHGFKPDYLAQSKWFKAAKEGRNYISEPFISTLDKKLSMVIAVPVKSSSGDFMGALVTTVDGLWLSGEIKDIVVGKTGAAYIIDQNETVIAHKAHQLVQTQSNAGKKVKNNPKLKSLVAFEKEALASSTSSIGFYEYEGKKKIASFAKIKNTDWTIIISAPEHEFLESINRLEVILMLVGIGMIGSALILIFMVARKMVEPVEKTSAFIKELGKGDLTAELDEKYININDEVGLIAVEVTNLQNKLIDIIGTIKMISTELATSSEETSATTQTFSENAQSQAAALEQINATLEEITAGMDSINDNTNSQIKSMLTVAEGIKFLKGVEKHIKNSVEYLANQSQEISSQTQESNSLLLTMQQRSGEIAKSSEQMLDIVKVINDVADQINLLSLNAAIESARAGEAGRGFAVVADEISKLADETQSNVKSIEASIMENNMKIKQGEEIVNQSIEKLHIVTEGVLGMAESVQGVDNEIDAQTQQSESLNSNIVEVKGKSESIQIGIQEMNIALGEITGSVGNVNQAVQSTAGGSEEVAGGAEQVAKLSQQLQEKVDFFQIPEN